MLISDPDIDKSQILTSIIVTVLVVAVAAYRLLWMAPSTTAAIGLRKFPKSPRKLFQWFLARRTTSADDDSRGGEPHSK